MKANIGTIAPEQSRTVLLNHPPVMEGRPAKPNVGTVPDGRVLACDADGLIVSYNAASPAPENIAVGVLAEELETAKDDVAVMLLHGTVRRTRLTVAGGAAPSATVFAELRVLGIYAI